MRNHDLDTVMSSFNKGVNIPQKTERQSTGAVCGTNSGEGLYFHRKPVHPGTLPSQIVFPSSIKAKASIYPPPPRAGEKMTPRYRSFLQCYNIDKGYVSQEDDCTYVKGDFQDVISSQKILKLEKFSTGSIHFCNCKRIPLNEAEIFFFNSMQRNKTYSAKKTTEKGPRSEVIVIQVGRGIGK